MKRASRLAPTRPSQIQPMRVRPVETLRRVRNLHGSAVRAALDGAINVEEYMRLEALNEH